MLIGVIRPRTKKARQANEEILVVFNESFARYRFEFGINNGSQIQPKPIDEGPAFSQNLSTRVNIKDGSKL